MMPYVLHRLFERDEDRFKKMRRRDLTSEEAFRRDTANPDLSHPINIGVVLENVLLGFAFL
jgi:hypothetical protein